MINMTKRALNIAKPALALAAVLACAASWADEMTTAQHDTDSMAAANMAKDFAAVAELTHPVVVRRAGGAAAVVKQLQTAYAGITINSMKFAKPEQVTNVGGTLVAIFPFREKLTVDSKQKSVEAHSFYIGFYLDRKSWKFIDCDGVTQAYLTALLPGYNNSLDLNGC